MIVRAAVRRAMLPFVALVVACGAPKLLRPSLHQPAAVRSMPPGTEPLKVHTRSGNLYVLGAWIELPGDTALAGSGTLFSPVRNPISSGEFVIHRDSIALLETNLRSVVKPVGLVGMAVWVSLLGTAATLCTLDPKACFGSCPTFYTGGETQDRPDAEGFSGSVARSLEATDIDALPSARVKNGMIDILMRNEALETHAVRSLRMLAVPRPSTKNNRVFAGSDGALLEVSQLVSPTACSGESDNCLGSLKALDASERIVPSDSTDLARKEYIDLEFPHRSGPMALVLGARHSFVSTYLFYQSIGFTGKNAGTYLANLERHGPESIPGAFELMEEVGGVEILRQTNDGNWSVVGVFGEHGPLATDVQVFPLGSSDGPAPVHIRLRLARGAWRLGYASLARVEGSVAPQRLNPTLVTNKGATDTLALQRLLHDDRYLVTYPGDAYTISFAVPPHLADAGFFLESRGYYYEWMRAEWLDEEDPLMLALIAFSPRDALKRLAPRFKHLEPILETQFWSSRFGRTVK